MKVFGLYSALVLLALVGALWPFPKTLAEQWGVTSRELADFGAIRSSFEFPPLSLSSVRQIALTLSPAAKPEVTEPEISKEFLNRGPVRIFADASDLYYQIGRTFARAGSEGSIRWAVEDSSKGGGSFSPPAFLESAVFVMFPTGKLACLDRETGKMRWSHRVSGASIGTSIAIAKDIVVAVVSRRSRFVVLGLNVQNGEIKWTSELGPGVDVVALDANAQGEIALGFSSGEIALIRGDSGESVWNRRIAGISSEIKALRILGTTMIVLTDSKTVLAYDFEKQRIVWSRSFTSDPSAETAISEVSSLNSKPGIWFQSNGERLEFLAFASGKTLRTLTLGAGLKMSGPPLIRSHSVTVPLVGDFRLARFQ